MKTRFDRNYKDYYTVNEVEQMRTLQRIMRADESKPEEYLKMAAIHIGTQSGEFYIDRVVEAEAVLCKNNFTEWDRMGDQCGLTDVMIKGVCIGYTKQGNKAYIEVDALLSDIYSLDGSTDFTQSMVWRTYTR